MADEKKGDVVPSETAGFDDAPQETHIDVDGPAPSRPAGWIYKNFRLGGMDLWYASPQVQLIMISFVCFLCPGMFNALSGLGGGGLGREHHVVQDNTNVALYATFAGVGFFAGTITNRLGLRPALAIGGIGYCVYSAAFLCFKHTENKGFVIFSGALLGVCAGLLWCAQGAIMMSYPPEQNKGRYISVFWIIFNLGGVIGSIVSPNSYFPITCPKRGSVTDLANNRSLLLNLYTARNLAPLPTVLTLPLSSSCLSVLSSPSFSRMPIRSSVRMVARLS